jgi:hypothetical protein
MCHPEAPRFHQRGEGSRVHRHRKRKTHAGCGFCLWPAQRFTAAIADNRNAEERRFSAASERPKDSYQDAPFRRAKNRSTLISSARIRSANPAIFRPNAVPVERG